jgi:phosphate/phosphite/phosphonate ABC transporter binding protein
MMCQVQIVLLPTTGTKSTKFGECQDTAMEKQSYPRSIAVLIAALLLAAGLKAEAQTKPETSIKTLTLGGVFQEPREPVEEHFRPLAAYVARKLSPSGETKGAVVVAPNAAQMMKLLEEKRVDYYMESPYPTYLINHLGTATLLLRRWKGGMAEYRSLIFTSKESGIARLEELRGKIIAFEDPGSTFGYFLPKLFLFKKGFSVVEKPNLGANVAVSEIGYTFAGTDKNVFNLVRQKKVAAGAFSNDDHSGLDEISKAAIAILGESESMPRHLVSVRKDLPEPVIKRLKEILLSMHQDEEGRKILAQTGSTTKFDALPGGEELVRRKLVELYRPRGNK